MNYRHGPLPPTAGVRTKSLLAALPLLLALVLTACSGAVSAVEPPPAGNGEVMPASSQSVAAGETVNIEGPYLLFNQRWLEGLQAETLDLDDVDAVFWHVFSRLPAEVVVYPTENYYYFIMHVDGRQVWGNIRLAAGRRERGVLSFAYFEFKESPFVTEPRVGRNKFFTDADGLGITELDRFTYRVRYNGKEVVFHLNQISQAPPTLFEVGEDEAYIMKTFDESGYRFILMFNEARNYFFWVLNEEEPLPDRLEPLADDLLVGRRSGFAFWMDPQHDNRKVLIAIRGQNATRNDYYDGPFDQLADNYVEQTRISDYIERASPSLRGRIDKYGYFTDLDRPSRVSISPYYVYFDENALHVFLDQMKAYEDPYYFISRRGRVETAATDDGDTAETGPQ